MKRVVKLGGSLLDRHQLKRDLTTWLSEQSPAQTLMIVGGGALIDAIRRLDDHGGSDPATVHWRCVDLLQTTFQFLSDWFPHWPTIDSVEQLQNAICEGVPVDSPTLVGVGSFYAPGGDDGLPHDWRTTSDAIAALLAIRWQADELVLLKSCQVDSSLSIDELAGAGIVDHSLPLIAGGVNEIRIEMLPPASQ